MPKSALIKISPWMLAVACVIIAGILLTTKKMGSTARNNAANNFMPTAVIVKKNVTGIASSDNLKMTKNKIRRMGLIVATKQKEKAYNRNSREINSMKPSGIVNNGNKNHIVHQDNVIVNRQALLGDLLNQLSKQEEKFVIDNAKDTLLACVDGTDVFIPALAFTGDSVTIKIKEFYKYSDMIANRLVTMSDTQQLISGGMIHLTAEYKGKEIQLNKGNTVTVYFPDTSPKDSMKIFYGEKDNLVSSYSNSSNTTARRAVNWNLSTISIDSPVVKMFIRALDLRDYYECDHYYKDDKVKGIFLMAKNSAFNKEQLKMILQKKYAGVYDKIVLKKLFAYNMFLSWREKAPKDDDEYGDIVSNVSGVGDTAELLPQTIKAYKLNPIDTVYEIVRWIYKGTRKIQLQGLSIPKINLKEIGEKYSIRLDKMGWINCDRFYKSKANKINYTVDLHDSSYNYYTMLVFNKYKSIMTGSLLNSTSIFFPNVPEGEKVKLICIGIDRQGKSVIAMKEGLTNGKIVIMPEFKNVSPDEIKASFCKMDK